MYASSSSVNPTSLAHAGTLRDILPRGEMSQPSAFALQRHTVPHLPALFPDLSPIEHIRDHLGRRVGHPTSLNVLEAMLQKIWNEISQDIILNLYASMPDRTASCIRPRGGSTGY
ncbi:transposable element Tcb1 transposase [Trichonephila clavipes]|nr:transposable element Tcb1 transposase [Trichonephila clavipes]